MTARRFLWCVIFGASCEFQWALLSFVNKRIVDGTSARIVLVGSILVMAMLIRLEPER